MELPTELVLSSVSFAADGRSVLTSGLSETTRDAQTEQPRLGVTASEDGVARIYSTAGGALVMTLSGHEDRLTSASFAPDGESVVTAGDDGAARIWTVAGSQELVLEGHTTAVPTAAFSSDGSRVLTSGRGDDTARIWDAASGEQLLVLQGRSNLVLSAAFDPAARRVVTGSADNTARIWDAATGRTRSVLSGHTDLVTAARFSPDGRFVVTASYDGTARLWDAATGEELTDFGEGIPLNDAAFDPTGTRIVTGGLGGRAVVYTCEICGSLEDLMREADEGVTRTLTAAERRDFLGEEPG